MGAMDVPQVQQVEVMKQTAALSQQRLVQTSKQYEVATQAFRTMPAESAGVYQAQVVGERMGAVQPTVVERAAPIMTTSTVPVAATVPSVEYIVEAPGAYEYVTAAPSLEYVT